MFSRQNAVLLLGDIIMFALAFSIMALVRFDVGAQGTRIWSQIELFGAIFVVWLVVFFIFELYNLRNINPTPRTVGLLIAAMAVNVLVGIAFFYFIPDVGIAPKTNLAILATSTLVLLIVWRRFFYFLFSGTFARRIALVGTTPLMNHLVSELVQNKHLGKIVGRFDQISDDITADIVIADGVDPRSLVAFSQKHHIETYTLPAAYETFFAKIPVSLLSDEKALSFLAHRENVAQSFIYRVLEIIVALVVLVIMSPFLLISIIAIYIEDGGPIIYTQTRVGKNGKLFTFYKLRNMKKNAEAMGVQWAQQNDPRSTQVGKILRKLHLDEIPQMWNIIKGDLALIGPRAERPEFVRDLEQQIPYYYLRHTIKPGFTGWAQIKFRYARTVDDSREKFEYDLYYLKNRSPFLDIGIVLKTLQIIFTH